MKKYIKQVKKGLAALMAVVLVLGMVPFTVKAGTGDVEILLNGKALAQNEEIGYAEIKDGRTLVPLRLVVEALGFTADWQVDGQKVITMRGSNKTVYHQVGTLEASSLSPMVQGAPVIATTDVPSYVDQATGRTMVGLRLISEAFGVKIEWKRNDTGGGKVIMTMDGLKDDLIWLDRTNSVSRSQIVDRLSQQQVEHSTIKDATRTVAEQAKAYTVPEKILDGTSGKDVAGRDVLVQRATGFMESLYNINYRADTADKVVNTFLAYSSPNTPNVEAWRELGVNAFKAAQDQQLIMKSVFVADESLVYELGIKSATYDRNGGYNGPPAEWGVRGTLFYQFESNSGGDYWENPVSGYNYEMGQWYWYDVEVRFNYFEGYPDGKVIAATDSFMTVVLNPDGTQVKDQSNSIVQPLSILP